MIRPGSSSRANNSFSVCSASLWPLYKTRGTVMILYYVAKKLILRARPDLQPPMFRMQWQSFSIPSRARARRPSAGAVILSEGTERRIPPELLAVEEAQGRSSRGYLNSRVINPYMNVEVTHVK